MKWYAVAHPGLEPVVAHELKELGVQGEVCAGGVRFDATPEAGLALLPWLRTPSRLMLELVTGSARSIEELTGMVQRIPWKTWLLPDAKVEVKATAKESRLHFTETVEKKVEWLIREGLKGPRVVERTPRATLQQRVTVRIEGDRATVSLDAGGELLHFRGWRQEQGPAAIRENLAACLLYAAGWQGDEALVDPFCGSGTILIEAALMQAGRSPYLLGPRDRRFACEEWPSQKRIKVGTRPAKEPRAVIVGSDRDARVIAAAEGNIKRAKVDVQVSRVDVVDLEPPAPIGLVVTNPPYGKRMGDGDRAYAELGRVLRERFTNWRALFLAPEPTQASRVHRDAKRLIHFSNGGVRVGVYGVDRL